MVPLALCRGLAYRGHVCAHFCQPSVTSECIRMTWQESETLHPGLPIASLLASSVPLNYDAINMFDKDKDPVGANGEN